MKKPFGSLMSSQINFRSHIYVLAFLLQLGLYSINAQEKTRLEIAQEYIDAYYAQDSTVYAVHMQDSITWSDPTSRELGTPITEVKGKQAVVSHLRRMSRDIVKLSFEQDYSFFSDVYAVFEGLMNYSWQDYQSKKIYNFSIRVVNILKFEGNKIIEHQDFGDFISLKKQFNQQRF